MMVAPRVYVPASEPSARRAVRIAIDCASAAGAGGATSTGTGADAAPAGLDSLKPHDAQNLFDVGLACPHCGQLLPPLACSAAAAGAAAGGAPGAGAERSGGGPPPRSAPRPGRPVPSFVTSSARGRGWAIAAAAGG